MHCYFSYWPGRGINARRKALILQGPISQHWSVRYIEDKLLTVNKQKGRMFASLTGKCCWCLLTLEGLNEAGIWKHLRTHMHFYWNAPVIMADSLLPMGSTKGFPMSFPLGRQRQLCFAVLRAPTSVFTSFKWDLLKVSIFTIWQVCSALSLANNL